MKRLILSILFVMSVCLSFAQLGTGFSGQVIDSKTQKPLQNVIATIQNMNLTEVSNAEGKFVFKSVPVGNQLLLIKNQGYRDLFIPIEIEAGKLLDLGVIVMEVDITDELQLSLVTLTDNDLGDDNSGSETTSGLLQASRDSFQQAAAFNWGQARFRIRGLDNEYANTMINGVVMNKIYDGRPQWGNWGGLNDATRNQEFTMGSAPSDYTFGGILGTQEINTRASIYRKGSRISFSGTNTNYTGRAMGTHVSGMNTNGWSFVVSASRRWAKEGYFDGTDYDANSLFVSVEKKINEKHSFNFTSILAQNSRGKTSPNTNEVNNLKGFRYNSYWGWQDGRKRNSRDKDIFEPINILSHYWKINEKTKLNTNVTYQLGHIGNSRIDFQSANNPDPTYYQNLPSFYYNNPDDNDLIDGVLSSDIALNNFTSNGQIDWNQIYYDNLTSSTPGKSVYVLYEDRNDDRQFTANTILFTSLADNITMNAGASYRKLKSHNYQLLTDLLGGKFFVDVDNFYSGDLSQTDLNNPNRQVFKGDEYGYNYNLLADVIDGFTQFKFQYKKADFYLAQSYSRSDYQREGIYRNGIYATNSFGKSERKTFENFGFKGGLTYKITGQHLLDFNGAYLTKAPGMRNVFSNARLNNNITPDINSERISSIDASYIIRMPKLKMRLTGFLSKIQNATELSFYYGEGLFDADDNVDEDSFISEIITGLDKKQIGGEFGIEYQMTSTIKLIGSASYGQYTYDNNPKLQINDDAQASSTNTNPLTDFGQVYLKDYRLPGMPQQAYSVGIEYRDPHFWWIGANANYLADSYLDVSNILRTNNFVIETGDFGFSGATNENVREILKQEKFDPFSLVNLTGGKSWKIDNTTFGFFASINNIFDTIYKTGGFEQSRKATYPNYVADNANGTPSFGSRYFYGNGRTYFVNLYVNF